MQMDVDTYVERARRLDMSGIDLAAFVSRPLSAEALRCLHYMHDVEGHTVCYLRDLLVTSAHRDAELTTFLTVWNYEELFHAQAIADVLAAHGEPSGRQRIEAHRRRLGWRDRLAPLTHLFGSWVVGPAFGAFHMTWGAINEWTTQAGYARLAARADHPELTEMLRRIMRQEGRHIDYYASRAANLLASSARARRLTRAALRRFWSPVGASVMPAPEVRFLVRYLFDDDEGRSVAQRIDRHVDRLPGLGGLRLVEGAVDQLSAA